MPDVIKPGPPGGDEDEQEEEQVVTMDVMGNSGREFPLQVIMLVLVLLGWVHANGLPVCRC